LALHEPTCAPGELTPPATVRVLIHRIARDVDEVVLRWGTACSRRAAARGRFGWCCDDDYPTIGPIRST
jgi:hypothetical protein